MSTKEQTKEIISYSDAFKRKVVEEIERGKLNKNQAMQLYGIKGGSTIHYWIKTMGKNHLLNKRVRIELKGEPKKLAELKKRNQELEKALADAYLKLRAYEYIDDAYGVKNIPDVKKKPESKQSEESKDKPKSQEKR